MFTLLRGMQVKCSEIEHFKTTRIITFFQTVNTKITWCEWKHNFIVNQLKETFNVNPSSSLFDRTIVRSNIRIRSLEQVSIRKSWYWRLYISETITTTETSFVAFGSTTLALDFCWRRNSNISCRFGDIRRERQQFVAIFLYYYYYSIELSFGRIYEFARSNRSAFENHDIDDFISLKR